MSEKFSAKQYAEQLLYKPEYAADKQPDVKEKAAAFAEGYKNFLDHAKTEREAAATSEQMLLAAGYKPFEPKKTYAPGEKIYFIQEHKAVVAATIGQKPFEEGFRLVIAHIDSPRLDLRPNPLYESDHLSYFKTHYYGGIWLGDNHSSWEQLLANIQMMPSVQMCGFLYTGACLLYTSHCGHPWAVLPERRH